MAKILLHSIENILHKAKLLLSLQGNSIEVTKAHTSHNSHKSKLLQDAVELKATSSDPLINNTCALEYLSACETRSECILSSRNQSSIRPAA